MSNIQIDANNRITIKGAREHNLKNVDLTLPLMTMRLLGSI